MADYQSNISKEPVELITDKSIVPMYNEAIQMQISAKNAFAVAETSVKIYGGLLKYYQNNWYAHYCKAIESEKAFFNSLKTLSPNNWEIIMNIYAHSKLKVAEVLAEFPGDFEKACLAANIDIDPTSMHPKYNVCQSFITVEVQTKIGEIHIYDRENTLARIPCDIPAIIVLLQGENKRLFGRKYDANKFLAKVYNQYRAIVNKEKTQDGDPLPIRKITSRLGKNEKGFRTDEFLIDLSKLVKQGPYVIQEKRMDLQQTKFEKQGMLLHGLEMRGYIGFIIFRKEIHQ